MFVWSFLLIYRFLPTHTFQPRLVVVCLHLRRFLWWVCFHSVRIVSTHSFLPSCLHPLPPPLTHSLPFIVVILCRNRTGKASATTKTVRAAGKKHAPAQRQPTRFDKDSTYGKLVPSLQWLKEFGLATQVRVTLYVTSISYLPTLLDGGACSALLLYPTPTMGEAVCWARPTTCPLSSQGCALPFNLC